MLPNLSVLWVIFFILVLTFVVDRLLLQSGARRHPPARGGDQLARSWRVDRRHEAQAAAGEFSSAKRGGAGGRCTREMDEMRRDEPGGAPRSSRQTDGGRGPGRRGGIAELDAETAAARRTLEAEAQTLGDCGGRTHPRPQGILAETSFQDAPRTRELAIAGIGHRLHGTTALMTRLRLTLAALLLAAFSVAVAAPLAEAQAAHPPAATTAPPRARHPPPGGRKRRRTIRAGRRPSARRSNFGSSSASWSTSCAHRSWHILTGGSPRCAKTS